ASVPAVGGVSKLLRAVPRAVAMQMLLTGDRIDPAEAHRGGLVGEVVASDDLLARALEIADRIAANGPLAIRSIKTLATRTEDLPLSRSVELEQLLWGILRDTRDRVEGRTAFAQRRGPESQGRSQHNERDPHDQFLCATDRTSRRCGELPDRRHPCGVAGDA